MQKEYCVDLTLVYGLFMGSGNPAAPNGMKQMANPTKFSRSAANPAFMSRRFQKTPEGFAAAQAFSQEQQAAGFRTQMTSAFGGRDMTTKRSFTVTVVHVFRSMEETRRMQEEAHARWEAREAQK